MTPPTSSLSHPSHPSHPSPSSHPSPPSHLSHPPVPPGWRLVPLRDLAEYINGRAFKPEDWGTTGLPIIRIQNLTSHAASFNYFAGFVGDQHLVQNGDLLISWSASLDAFLWCRGPAVLNQHIFKVRERSDVVRRDYLYFAVREAMDEIRAQVHGATMRHITKPEFEAITVPLPPLPEQRRIAAVLTEQMNAVERARAAAEEQLEAASTLRRAFVNAVFESDDSRQWTQRPFASLIADMRYGTSVRSDGIGFPTLRIPNIVSGRIDLSDLKLVPIEEKGFASLRIEDGDLLFVRTNGNPHNVGRNAVFFADDIRTLGHEPTRFIFASYLIRVRLIQGPANPSFIHFYLTSGPGREALLARCRTSAGQYNISTVGIGGVSVPVPERAVQDELVRALNGRLSSAAQAKARLVEQSELVSTLPAALLREAFAGKL